MQHANSLEDEELDRMWRAEFGEPLPILGCGSLVRAILEEHRSFASRASDQAVRSQAAPQQ